MSRPIDLKQYAGDEPLFLADSQVLGFNDPVEWQTVEAWVASLESMERPPRAVILPLELPAPGWSRQDLYGMELLSHLRWSAPESIRCIPVLAIAWQPLIDVLRKRADFLLIKPAIDFCRLPEALDRVTKFADDVAKGNIQATSIAEIEIDACKPSLASSSVSYHDLANDYYAAYRLWMGYKGLLRQAQDKGVTSAKAELERVLATHLDWEPKLRQKLRTPLVRQFQASRIAVQIPRYPVVDSILEIVEHHLNLGLPADTRILFVDDEFEKGSAEVLLQMLFRASSFTRRVEDEWVYCEESSKNSDVRWARFVCVRSVPLALNWLVHWGEIPESCLASRDHWTAWLGRWSKELTGSAGKQLADMDSQDILGENREFVLDSKRSSPRSPYTVMLLDLRLKPVTETLYSVREFPSVGLRTLVKSHKPELPVIIFTASRQIMNSAELLDSTREIDGWLVKEGPDIPVDPQDANSASAAAYLFERIHLYSTLGSWYRESFGWDTKRKLACAQLYSSTHAQRLLGEISGTSQRVFDEIREGKAVCPPGDTFLAFIQKQVSAHPFAVVQTLVARRVALATLLMCATTQNGSLEWDANAAEDFDQRLPGRPAKKLVIAVYDKLNFNQVLWMRSANLLSQLLREEFDWLESQTWPDEKRHAILNNLRRERELLEF